MKQNPSNRYFHVLIVCLGLLTLAWSIPGEVSRLSETSVLPGGSWPSFSDSAQASALAIPWPQIDLFPYASGFSRPVHLTHAGDSTGRLFVVEQAGTIQILHQGKINTTPFLDIQSRVLFPGSGEQGLLSVAFPADYTEKGYFYVYYTNQNGDNQVSRFSISADPDLADPASEELVLYLNHPTHTNHNGGQLAFGPDGYLYIGTGDGGSGGDPDENGQDPDSLLGKILRIDVESGVSPYGIPATNPFTGTAGYRGEIWALGLRNPWRFSFDRLTGDLYIGDVGQGIVEEIDFQQAISPGGENYGWDILEGDLCYEPSIGCVPPANYSAPVATYNHDNGNCSVNGGFVARSAQFDDLNGIYFYADFCSGRIWGLQFDGQQWQNSPLDETGLGYTLVSFGEDQAGNLFLTGLNGDVYLLVGRSSQDQITLLPLVIR